MSALCTLSLVLFGVVLVCAGYMLVATGIRSFFIKDVDPSGRATTTLKLKQGDFLATLMGALVVVLGISFIVRRNHEDLCYWLYWDVLFPRRKYR